MTLIRSVAAMVLASALVAGDVAAQGRGNGGRKKGGETADVAVNIIFTDAHRMRVREYYVAHPVRLAALPPGIAKNVARGKRLPPGIAKRGVPRDVLVLLPAPQPGVTFAIVGDMVVAERSGVVVDVMLRIVD
jgi:hypothetical protein